MKLTRTHHSSVHLFMTHWPTLTLQLHNFDLFRTCRTSSFCTVAWQLARFPLTQRIARSLGDSWASCLSSVHINITQVAQMPSVLGHCWLGVRKSILSVKIKWWGVGVVICLQQGADCLHMVQLMPLHPKTSSSLAYLIKSRLILPFWYQLTQTVLEKRPLNECSSSSSSK